MTVSRRTVALALALAIATIPVGAAAGHFFLDVAETNPFHGDIERITEAGITRGCTPAGDLYCPEDPVTRQQMAGFLARTAGHLDFADDAQQRILDAGDGHVDLLVDEFTVPGVGAEAHQMVYVRGVVSALHASTDCAPPSRCGFELRMQLDGEGLTPASTFTIHSGEWDELFIEHAWALAPGTYTLRLQGFFAGDASNDGAVIVARQRTFTMTFPSP